MEHISIMLYDTFGAIITALIGWLGVHAVAWIKSKSLNERSFGALARLTESVAAAVQQIDKTLKRELLAAKDPSSPGGATITKEEAALLKGAAMKEIRSHWGERGLHELAHVIGLDGTSGLERLIAGKIEEQIANP